MFNWQIRQKHALHEFWTMLKHLNSRSGPVYSTDPINHSCDGGFTSLHPDGHRGCFYHCRLQRLWIVMGLSNIHTNKEDIRIYAPKHLGILDPSNNRKNEVQSVIQSRPKSLSATRARTILWRFGGSSSAVWAGVVSKRNETLEVFFVGSSIQRRFFEHTDPPTKGLPNVPSGHVTLAIHPKGSRPGLSMWMVELQPPCLFGYVAPGRYGLGITP